MRLLEISAEMGTPIEALYDLLRRALDYLAAQDPTEKAVLHYERQLADILGIASPGLKPIDAIRSTTWLLRVQT